MNCSMTVERLKLKVVALLVSVVTLSLFAFLYFRWSSGTAEDCLRAALGQPDKKSIRYNNILDDLVANGWTNFRPISSVITQRVLVHENPLKTAKDSVVYRVPNIVHYIWLGKTKHFTFIDYLSFLSVHRFIHPDVILVYGETGPRASTWWNRTLHDVHNIYHVVKDVSLKAPSGQPFRFIEHRTDLLRLQILQLFGGIYLDTDVFVLKTFDALRRYPMVMGRHTADSLGNGIMVAEKRAPFIEKLLRLYDNYAGLNESWNGLSVLMPLKIATKFPHLIRIEETSLLRPHYAELPKMFDIIIDWSNNFAMHIWIRMFKTRRGKTPAERLDDINCLNTTFGEISRHIYYGVKDLVCKSTNIKILDNQQAAKNLTKPQSTR